MSILLYNAEIFGSDAEYILVNGNRIEKIGKGVLPEASKKVDLKGAVILPGFCDSHTHLENIALMHKTTDLTGLSREDVLYVIKEKCEKEKIVVGRGWDESFWENKNIITSDEIESMCPGKVVILIREDGHMAIISKKAAEKCGVKTTNGVVKESALEKCLKKMNVFSSLDFKYAQKYAIERGVTCVHDFATFPTLNRYFKMHAMGDLKIRIYASFYEESYTTIKSLGLHSGFGDSFLKIGALKLFADGSIGAETAATVYRNGTLVEPLLNREELRKRVMEANANHIRVFTHAIGNLAISEVLEAYRNTHGNRIEHFEMPEDDCLVEGQEVSVQPNFLKWAKVGGLYHKKLGEEWLQKNNPYRKMLSSGMKVLFGSDCMPLSPLYGIRQSLSSEYQLQKLSWEEAVRLYTMGAKYMADNLGELKEGYLADITVVFQDAIVMTMVNGEIRYLNSHPFSPE